MRRYADRRDNNEPRIIEYLNRIGCSVQQISQEGVPDLLVGIPTEFQSNLLLEVKGETGTLTPYQSKFFSSWKGHKAIIRSITEAKLEVKKFMPVRVYKCEKCGIIQQKESIKSNPKTECPTCGGKLIQIYSAPVIVFRGNGWGSKEDDSRRDKNATRTNEN